MKIELPPKPKRGQPCNGCGFCCSVEICGLGEMAYPGAVAPCPGLKISPGGTRTYCELVAIEAADQFKRPSKRPTSSKPWMATALGIGRGCCSDDEQP